METYRLETADKAEFKQAIVEAQAAGDVEVTIVTGTEGKRTENGFTQVAYFMYPSEGEGEAPAEEAPAPEPPAEEAPAPEAPAEEAPAVESTKPAKGKT